MCIIVQTYLKINTKTIKYKVTCYDLYMIFLSLTTAFEGLGAT